MPAWLPYLGPVAEHLPVASVGHQLLWKLKKMWHYLRWGCGQGEVGPLLAAILKGTMKQGQGQKPERTHSSHQPCGLLSMAVYVKCALRVKIPCKGRDRGDLINNDKVQYDKILLSLFILKWLLESYNYRCIYTTVFLHILVILYLFPAFDFFPSYRELCALMPAL